MGSCSSSSDPFFMNIPQIHYETEKRQINKTKQLKIHNVWFENQSEDIELTIFINETILYKTTIRNKRKAFLCIPLDNLLFGSIHSPLEIDKISCQIRILLTGQIEWIPIKHLLLTKYFIYRTSISFSSLSSEESLGPYFEIRI